jgi:hypothetical protein
MMSKPVGQTGRELRWTRFSEGPEDEREGMLLACRQVTDGIYQGQSGFRARIRLGRGVHLNAPTADWRCAPYVQHKTALEMGPELRTVAHQGLSDTVLVWDDGRLAGLADCHDPFHPLQQRLRPLAHIHLRTSGR